MSQLNIQAVINDDGSVSISWSPIPKTVKYDVRMYSDKIWVFSEKNFTATSYRTAKNLEAGQVYYITVTSVAANNSSLASEKKTLIFPSDFYTSRPVGVPQNVKAKAMVSAIEISFDAVQYARSYDILFDNTVYNTTGTTKLFTGLPSKSNHTYAVRAKNAKYTGNYSKTQNIQTLPVSPAVPGGIRKTATETSATISWNAVSGAIGYDILFNGSTYSLTATTRTFTGLTPGRSYTFQVRARNADVAGAYSSSLTVATPARPPASVSAVSTEQSITVNWSKVEGAFGYYAKLKDSEVAMPGSATSNVFSNLLPKTSYTYQVCCRSQDGTGSYSPAKSITTLAKAPVIPADLSCETTENSATVRWNAVSGATGYDVLFDGNVYSVSGTSRTFTGLQENTEYGYRVRSKNSDRVGEYSPEKKVKTTPKAPAGASGVCNENSATISWNAVAGATSYDLLFNGKVYRVSGTSYKVTGLTPNSRHTCQVRVNNANGSSSYCAAVTFTTTPRPPANSSVSTAQTSVVVRWDAVSGATGYDVLFNGKVYSTTGTVANITGLQPNTSYSYSIRVCNQDGSSSYSSAKTVKTLPYAPSTYPTVQAVCKSDSVTLSWNAVSGATKYDLEFDKKVYTMTGTSRTFTGLESETKYSFRIRAGNDGGYSRYSPYQTATTDMQIPGVPTGITATPDIYTVDIKWDPVPKASVYEVLFDGSVYASDKPSNVMIGLRENTTYRYQVRAGNRAGKSAYSAAQTVKTRMRPPLEPVSVKATATSDSVTITWYISGRAAGYRISLNGTVYQVTGETTTTKTISGLLPGTEYEYAVCAYNDGGSSRYSSPKTICTIPSAPAGLAAEPKAHSVKIIWQRTAGADKYTLTFNGQNYVTSEPFYEVDGLNPNTVYQFRVNAGNASGSSAFSSYHETRTLLETPANVRAEVKAREITVSFDEVTGADSYLILFGGETYSTTVPCKTFTGLEPEKEYTYSVCAKNAYVESEYSEQQSVETLPAGPAVPSDVMAQADLNSVTVSFSPVSGADDYDIKFDDRMIHVSQEEAPAAQNMEAYSGSETYLMERWQDKIYRVFSGLKPNTEHTYCVRANNAEGSSKFSAQGRIMTDISRQGGLADRTDGKVYPDGRMSYTGNDPVSALTGAFLWSYTWLKNFGRDGLHFTAMYDSRRDEVDSVLGKKWSYSFNYILYMDENYMYFSMPYGDVIPFVKEEGNSFRPAEGVQTVYTMVRAEDGSYVVEKEDGTRYVFDSGMHLSRIEENGLVKYRFETNTAGQIIGIKGRHRESLSLTYTGGHITGVTDTMENTVSFTYEAGRLVSAANADGRSMSFTYDERDRLLSVSDFAGQVYLVNQYDARGRIVKQNTAGRGDSHVSYDENNRRTVFRDELGHAVSYWYDEAGCITDIESEGDNIQNSYDGKGRLIKRVDALGNITQMSYDACGRMNCVTYPDGSKEQVFYNDRNLPVKVVKRDGAECLYRYDDNNNLIEAQDERGNSSIYAYDEEDHLISCTDKNGNVWTYAYDEADHLQQAQNPDGNLYQYSHDAAGRMTSYTSPDEKTISYQYSAAGDLIQVEDADGTVVFAYDANGNRTSVTDRRGNEQRMEYNAMGQLTLVTDYMGNEYHFSYDQKGNLKKKTDPLGAENSYVYDARGNNTAWTDGNGNMTAYSFDACSQLTEVTDAAGGIVHYAYDTMGRVTTITDPLAHQTSYTYDAEGRVTGRTDALGSSVSYTYDQAGNLLTRTDEEGVVTAYAYDEDNRLISITSAAGVTRFTYDKSGRVTAVEAPDGSSETAAYDADGKLTQFSDREANKTTYVYDKSGRIAEITLPNGAKTAYQYDANGNCTKITDAEGHSSSFVYDANNRMTAMTDPEDRTTDYVYDAAGRLISVTDARGSRWTFTYDNNGNLVSETNPLGGIRIYRYDCLNRRTESQDEEGHKRLYAYDEAGNLISFTDANDNKWTYAYDAANRLTSVTDQNGDSLAVEYTKTGKIAKVTDKEGVETSYSYDDLGRMTCMQDAMQHSLEFTYDKMGRVLTRKDANGNVTEYTYSPAGHLLTKKDPEGGITTYAYNAAGQIEKMTDAAGNTTSYTRNLLGQVTAVRNALEEEITFTYTANGQIETVTDALGSVTTYAYDAGGNLIRVTDALGNVTEYEYDAMNNQIRECLSTGEEAACVTLYQYDQRGCMVRVINPMAEEQVYAYDGNGNPVTVTDEEGNETTVRYDLNNQPVELCYGDGRQAVFRYNRRGELVEMKDWNGTAVMEHDLLGRLTKVTDHNGNTTGYTYDAAGNRISIHYPDESVVNYTYDGNHRLTGVTDQNDAGTRYQYDPAGNLLSAVQPGSSAAYTYNAVGKPVTVEYRAGDGSFLTENLTYDGMGRIASADRQGSIDACTGKVSYGYDALGQLISCMKGQDTESYTYDALGNRTNWKINGVEKAECSYDAMNRLTAAVIDGVPFSYAYDKRGNLTEEKREESLIRQYAYDSAGRMVLGKDIPGGAQTAYSYNALGMRVKNIRTYPGTETPVVKETTYAGDFLSRTNNDLMAYGTDGSAVGAVYGRSYERLGRLTAEGQVYELPDLWGSPVLAADARGSAAWQARDIWGRPGQTGPDGTGNQEAAGDAAWRFTSYSYDPVIGKYFAQARFYDSEQGRMLSRDPVKRGLNAYRYCDNDPVNYVDPTGEVPGILAGALLGGLFGGLSGFLGSASSQVSGGGGFSMRRAIGSAANGAVIGAVRGAVIGTGIGIPSAFAADFAAGAAGSALEQLITGGSVDAGGSILAGAQNALGQLAYGTGELTGVGNAFARGARTGAVSSALDNLADAFGIRGGGQADDPGSSYGGPQAGMTTWPGMGAGRDPRRLCGAPDPFDPWNGLGDGNTRGYQYGRNHSTGGTQESGGFSLGGFVRDTLTGAVLGGLGSAGFYGAGRAVEVLRGSVGWSKGGLDTFSYDYYIPRDENGNIVPLSKQIVNGRDIPIPDPSAQGRPHTVLGGAISTKTGVPYRQSASFGGETWPSANGYDVPLYETHWYNHGRGDHAVPHKHIFYYDSSNGGWQRGNHSLF